MNEALRRIWFLGDVHGRFDHIAPALERLQPLQPFLQPKWLVFLGDVDPTVPLEQALAPLRAAFPSIRVGELSTVRDSLGIEGGADVVVLAGDISEGERGIRWARETFLFTEIVYVAGNHEFYGHEFEALMDRMREVGRQMGVHFLERDAVTIDGERFLGTTLWTNFDLNGAEKRDESMARGGRGLNDFSWIKTLRGFERNEDSGIALRNFKPADARQEHDMSVAWLDAELAKGEPSIGSDQSSQCIASDRDALEPLMRLIWPLSLNGGLHLTYALAAVAGYEKSIAQTSPRPRTPLKKAQQCLLKANELAGLVGQLDKLQLRLQRPSVVIQLLTDCMTGEAPPADRQLAQSLLATVLHQKRKTRWSGINPQLSQLMLF